ncbi:SGNH/GDSL hydrolase family protein [Alteromonas halophila]|uniref:Lipase n=1 Tax=Alteromonas halophila TaxID=516698 RepID=A0A918MYU7_9ALTE|nr:SGNH/GDSL hydrolase family protein [Alteromonas halophila]GGW89627.1 lipase [Alteromonas halophila]
MRSRLMAVLLFPLLMMQGRRVRRDTPKLPEAAGPRSGIAGSGPPLSLWIIGDSAGAGVGVASQRDALSGQLSALLATQYQVDWQCHAHTGYCASDVAHSLSKLPVSHVDVMVCSVGVNDVVAFRSVKQWLRDVSTIYELAGKRFGVRQLIFSLVPPMQDFPALPSPLNRLLGDHARQLNAALTTFAARHDKVAVAALPGNDTASMMASDGFHPGVKGYRLWAEEIVTVLQSTQPERSESSYAPVATNVFRQPP